MNLDMYQVLRTLIAFSDGIDGVQLSINLIADTLNEDEYTPELFTQSDVRQILDELDHLGIINITADLDDVPSDHELRIDYSDDFLTRRNINRTRAYKRTQMRKNKAKIDKECQ